MSINTNLNVAVTANPRTAGVESGRLHNDWLDCPFKISRAESATRGYQRGFKWQAIFKTTDGAEKHITFNGVADSRKEAMVAVFNALTSHMNAIARERSAYIVRTKAVLKTSVEAGVAVDDGYLHKVGATASGRDPWQR